MATFLAFPVMARDEVQNIVNIGDDLLLVTQPGPVLVPLPHEVCEANKEIGGFALL